MLKKTLKKMGWIMLIIIGLFLTIALLFLNLSPQFGAKITVEQKEEYSKSKHFTEGKFYNEEAVNMEMSFGMMRKMLKEFSNAPKTTIPNKDIPTLKIDSLNVAEFRDSTRLIWFGHSAFLLQIANKNILIDPMFGETPAPHPWFGGKRFSKELPIEIEKLPSIDAVLISHDHYDHLDYPSIIKLKEKVKMFYTPLGVGAHLQKWGIDKSRIVELDWWQDKTFDNLVFRCTPAKHFSGRGLLDRYSTLWSSWIVKSDSMNIFFSGDSGYGAHFQEIGEKFGPFDFAMLECGQYNKLWEDIHMFPEQTAQAGIDLKAKKIMPIHWGAFKLAVHPWTESVERMTKKSEELKMDYIIPKIGESNVLESNQQYAQEKWWRNY